jgi:hypothetical protein
MKRVFPHSHSRAMTILQMPNCQTTLDPIRKVYVSDYTKLAGINTTSVDTLSYLACWHLAFWLLAYCRGILVRHFVNVVVQF